MIRPRPLQLNQVMREFARAISHAPFRLVVDHIVPNPPRCARNSGLRDDDPGIVDEKTDKRPRAAPRPRQWPRRWLSCLGDVAADRQTLPAMAPRSRRAELGESVGAPAPKSATPRAGPRASTSAKWRPMPLDAPVTSTTCPVTSKLGTATAASLTMRISLWRGLRASAYFWILPVEGLRQRSEQGRLLSAP